MRTPTAKGAATVQASCNHDDAMAPSLSLTYAAEPFGLARFNTETGRTPW
jgi:hypothetical protein